MKIRNPFALRARHRQAGVMHDRRAPRGGEDAQVKEDIRAMLREWRRSAEEARTLTHECICGGCKTPAVE